MPKRSQDVPVEYTEYEGALAKAIGARVRQRRLELKFTQELVRMKMEAEGVHTTRARYSRIENGKYLPNAAEIIAFMQVFGVSAQWLLVEKPTMYE